MSDSILWNISEDDINKNKLVDAGWHATEIIDFAIEDSKKKDSKNLHLTYRIFIGEFKGVENGFIYFSEKLPLLMAPLLDACGFPKNEKGAYSVNLSKEVMIGKKFLAHWKRGEYEGKPVNQVDEYAPLPNS